MADQAMNPFAAMTPPPKATAEAVAANPFDVFAPATPTKSPPQPESAADAANRTISPPPPAIASANPFAAMTSTPVQTAQFESLQISDKPVVNEPQYPHQQPWPHPNVMGNGQQVAMPQEQQQPQVPMQQPRQEQVATQQQSLQQQPSFQPEATVAAPTPDQNPFSSFSPPQAVAQTPSVENPWTSNQPQPVLQNATPFDSVSMAPQQAPYVQPPPVAVNPFANQSFQPGANYAGAIIPSQQASNPYAGLVVPQQQQMQQHVYQQAMVPAVQQQTSQWSMGAPAVVAPVTAGYDPFAPAPPPAPAPAPPPAAVVTPTPLPVAQSEALYTSNSLVPTHSSGYSVASTSLVPAPSGQYPGAPAPMATSQSYAKSPPVPSSETKLAPAQKSDQSRTDGSHAGEEWSTAGDEHRQMVPYNPDGHQIDRPNDRQLAVVPDDDVEKPKRNLFSEALAKNAPPGSAPLPKADQVVKSGFVLSRISFRTIFMKTWKQTYWVQYGPHTMLWFRSQADFDDWLNNPYHTPAQRNFLIKLAVNFVHDLYKPNVRGYQVTQARTKSYGREQIKQFKLERWMDYGPTIAAAFGSQDHREVDNLRQALVECMRNTPLEGGIRATGAVRRDHDERSSRQASDEDDDRDRAYSYDSERNAGASYDEDDTHDRPRDRDRPNRSNDHQAKNAPTDRQEPSQQPPAAAPPTGDLLDDSFFEVPLNTNQQPQQPPYQPVAAASPSHYPVAAASPSHYPGAPQGYAQAAPAQPPFPPQGHAQPQQFQQQQQQQAPLYAQPSPQQHYFGFPPIPPQFQHPQH